MNQQEIGKSLLNSHLELLPELIKIPTERKMNYSENIIDLKLIGKPRFNPVKYSWDPKLLVKLRDHLQKIWNFLTRYSYWMDESIHVMLATSYRQSSKKSLIFLIENDVWNTDEIYGDYLIEELEENCRISYTRRGQSIKSFTLEVKTYEDRSKWIIDDSRKKIQNQIKLLWKKLEVEIQSCLEERYKKRPKIKINNMVLQERLKLLFNVKETSPETGMLLLGWIAEQWTGLILGKLTRKYGEHLIEEALVNQLITKDIADLLHKIRRKFNKVKHDSQYQIPISTLETYILQFSDLLK
jgi:hypothetical protein